MMNFNRYLILYIASALLFLTPCKAQLIYKSTSEDYINKVLPTRSVESKNNRYKLIEGSAYYTEDFVLANLILADETFLTGVPVRLDLYKSEIEVKIGGEIRVVSMTEQVHEVRMSNDTLLYFPASELFVLEGFYKTYYSGRSMVLAKQEVIFRPAEVANSNYAVDKPDRFSNSKEILFFVLPDSSVFEVSSKKQFYNEVQSINSALYEFIKENKVNPMKIKDLIDLAHSIDESAHVSD